jgi:hypothetical protein
MNTDRETRAMENGTGRKRGAGAWLVRAGIPAAAVALLMGPLAGSAEGQRLAEFDYENLKPRGAMLSGGWVRPGSVDPTSSFGGRVDLGFLGPGVRVTAGFSRWSSTLRRSEVAAFETQVADLIEAETGDRPNVNLGILTWSDVALHADAHVVWRVPGGLLTYVGGGGTAHVMRGGGDAIEGTFIEDLLNTIRAGVNLHAGLEVPVAERWRIVGESRLEVVQSVSYGQVRVGVQYTWGEMAPGEQR